MSTLKELKTEAKTAGISGYSAMNTAQLEAALGYTTDEQPDPPAPAEAPLIGVPTRSAKWIADNLTEAELETAIIAAEVADPAPSEPVENLGVPTEPEKTGEGPPAEPAPRPPKAPPPSHSGNDIEAGIGIPTEPDRGGLNPTEIAASGATPYTAAGKKAIAEAKRADKRKKKAAKAAAKVAKDDPPPADPPADAKTTEPEKATTKS